MTAVSSIRRQRALAAETPLGEVLHVVPDYRPTAELGNGGRVAVSDAPSRTRWLGHRGIKTPSDVGSGDGGPSVPTHSMAIGSAAGTFARYAC